MKKTNSDHSLSKEDFMTVKMVADYLDVSISTVYSWNHKKKIRRYKLNGRRVFFLKKDIDDFVFNEMNCCKSMKQLEAEVYRESLQKGRK